MITGAAMVTYLGAKVHRCLHPRHVASQEFTWTPASLPSLELGIVSGTLNVRSCPKAKNVTLTVRTYAGTEDLLNTMVLQRDPLSGSLGERLVLLAPSFDMMHCQRAVFDLVVPENMGLDLKAQGLLGRVDVRASKHALRNLVVSTSVAHVDVHSSELSGILRVDSEVGCVRARDISASEVHAEIRVGFLDARHIKATGSVATMVRLGSATLQHIDAHAGTFTHSSELARVNMWDVAAQSVKARVDYGSLVVAVPNDFAGTFSTRSPYGFLKLSRGTHVASRLNVMKESLAEIVGSVNAETQTEAHQSAVELDAVYGSVDLFVPDPDTQWERRHHRRP
jgi:hypothetical protein